MRPARSVARRIGRLAPALAGLGGAAAVSVSIAVLALRARMRARRAMLFKAAAASLLALSAGCHANGAAMLLLAASL